MRMENPLASSFNTIAIIGYVWPEKDASAAGMRTWNLLQIFKEADYDVHYLCGAKENVWTKRVQDMGAHTHSITLNHDSFDTLIKKISPHTVIFDRFITEEQFGWRVEQSIPQAIRIIDTQDLHFLRQARQKKIEENTALDLWNRNTLRELASIYRTDATLILSSYEYKLLTQTFHLPEKLLHLLPFSYPTPPSSTPSFSQRKHFVFLGNFRHPPNQDAILHGVEHIWPSIRQALPQAEWHIYGAYPPKNIMKLHNPGIHVMGPVKDHLSMLSQYRVNLAPLRFGAGIKGKITDGWFMHTPCVTTPIGAEGMEETQQWKGTELASPFIHKALQLYTQEKEWQKAQSMGLNQIKGYFSHTRNKKLLLSLVSKLQRNKQQERKENIVGAILREEQFQSTKYLSRWIQEKNK